MDEARLRAALERLTSAPLPRGYRGRPVADAAAVIVCAQGPTGSSQAAHGLVEVEINPLMVEPEGKGAAVADALVTAK